MKALGWLFICLLVPFYGGAKDLYKIRHLSEHELLSTYTSIMHDGCKFADRYWHDWDTNSAAGMWGTGRSDLMNEGVRAIAEMVLTSGALLKYSDVLTSSERAEYTRKALAAVRYCVATHVTGSQKCPDGKPWGNTWQSAMWTGDLAFGTWLIWDQLDTTLQKDLERVVAFEADRFLNGRPLAGSSNDTKAEENGWNLTCLAVAANMFPANPHAAVWHQKAQEYMMNTLSAPQDREDKTIVDGRPVSEWFTGANIHDDFTLENHGFFHPAYVACSSYFMTQTALYYTFAGNPVPATAKHHVMDVWKMFQTIILPWGEAAYPQGMDWELHGLPYFNLYASLASYAKDPLAARLEDIAPQYMRQWQLMCDGDLAVPGSKLGFTRHAICAEQAAWAFLAHKIFGLPVKALSARAAAEAMVGIHLRDSIKTATHRTNHKFVSVSWGNKIMGMVLPIEAHFENPNFTVPIANGLIGSFELSPHGDAKATVTSHSWQQTADGFETSATLLLNGGRLRQTVTIRSIGEHAVVYDDQVTALTNVTVVRERGFPLAIENDKITGGTRTVTHSSGKILFDWEQVQKPLAISGSWANVDDRLGIVMLSGNGLNYTQATGYQPGISVCPDIFYGSYSEGSKSYKTGEEIARRVALLFVETTAAKTKKLATSVSISGKTLQLPLPEGGQRSVSLH